MDLTKEQKQEIKRVIETDCVGFLMEMDAAKNDLNETAKNIQESFGLKAATFKKMVRVAYLDSLEEEKAKSEEFYNDYKEIMEEEEN